MSSLLVGTTISSMAQGPTAAAAAAAATAAAADAAIDVVLPRNLSRSLLFYRYL